MARKLTLRERTFINLYFKLKVAEKAAVESGYTVKTARARAHQWVGGDREKSSNKTLWDAIRKRRKKLEGDMWVSEQEIMEGYRRLAFYDGRDFVNPDGTAKHLHELSDDAAKTLQGFEVVTRTVLVGKDHEGKDVAGTEVTKKFKLPTRRDPLDSLSKIKGMFQNDNEQLRPVMIVPDSRIQKGKNGSTD